VVAAVNPHAIKRRTITSALPESAWIRDITATHSTEATIQFIHLVDIIGEQELQPDSQDPISWNFSESGFYTAKSAYKAFLEGSTFSPHHSSIWECWSPLECKVFAWLVSLDRCWTAERRMRHGLSNDDNVRYVIMKLSLFHTCLSNVHCLSKLDLLGCMPRTDESFNTWFTSAASHDS
jgi:hypothetical protein